MEQINWDKVAQDPILSEQITNGHAARMRYSRFKKQMDAANGIQAPSTPRKPRKNRVEKNRSPKKEKNTGKLKNEKGEEEELKRVKKERVHEGREGMVESVVGSEGESFGASVESPGFGSALGMGGGMDVANIKRERKPSTIYLQRNQQHASSSLSISNSASNTNSTLPNTPRMCIEQSPSPRESFMCGAGEMSDMDELMTSFNLPHDHHHHGHSGLFSPLMGGEPFGMGGEFGGGLGMGVDPYEGFWGVHEHQTGEASGGGGDQQLQEMDGQSLIMESAAVVAVKKEPRWEEQYRHV